MACGVHLLIGSLGWVIPLAGGHSPGRCFNQPTYSRPRHHVHDHQLRHCCPTAASTRCTTSTKSLFHQCGKVFLSAGPWTHSVARENGVTTGAAGGHYIPLRQPCRRPGDASEFPPLSPDAAILAPLPSTRSNCFWHCPVAEEAVAEIQHALPTGTSAHSRVDVWLLRPQPGLHLPKGPWALIGMAALQSSHYWTETPLEGSLVSGK